MSFMKLWSISFALLLTIGCGKEGEKPKAPTVTVSPVAATGTLAYSASIGDTLKILFTVLVTGEDAINLTSGNVYYSADGADPDATSLALPIDTTRAEATAEGISYLTSAGLSLTKTTALRFLATVSAENAVENTGSTGSKKKSTDHVSYSSVIAEKTFVFTSPTPSPSPTASPTPSASPTPTPTATAAASLGAIAYTLGDSFTYTSGTYGTHETAARTLTFTSAADSATCSHDGGTTYAACDAASTVLWTKADYDGGVTIKVKLVKAGYDDTVISYAPKTAHSGLTFYTCTNLVSADTTFAVLEALLTAARVNQVTCVSAGVTITNAVGSGVDEINFLADGATLIGTQENRPVITNLRTDSSLTEQSAINQTEGTGNTIANLDIRAAGNSGFPLYFLAHTEGSVRTETINYVKFTSAVGSSAFKTGGGLRNYVIGKSSFNAGDGTGSGNSFYATSTETGLIDITGSSFSGIFKVDAGTHTLNVGTSTFYLGQAGGAALSINGAGTTATISSSTIRSNYFILATTGFAALTLTSNKMRGIGTQGSQIGALSLASGLMVNGTGNTICSEVGGSSRRYDLVFHTNASAGTFSPTGAISTTACVD